MQRPEYCSVPHYIISQCTESPNANIYIILKLFPNRAIIWTSNRIYIFIKKICHVTKNQQPNNNHQPPSQASIKIYIHFQRIGKNIQNSMSQFFSRWSCQQWWLLLINIHTGQTHNFQPNAAVYKIKKKLITNYSLR